jgi:cyclophilin family peptidyl-prolyl cis-trans isomerase
MKKIVFAILVATLALGSCQSKYPDLDNGVYAEFITNKGTFVAKLYNEATPLTTANFVSLAEGKNSMVDSTLAGKKYFNGLTFHRVIKDFMIQGGDPKGDGTGSPGYTFPDEFVDSLTHKSKGILSMANSGPATNGSQFFITLKETPWLDGKHTVFGEIVMGQEVVDSIGSVEVQKPSNKPVDAVTINEVNIINKGNVKVAAFEDAMAELEKEKKEKEERIAKVGAETLKYLLEQKENAETLESGLQIVTIEKGDGGKPDEGSAVTMNYAGYLAEDGKLFDSNIQEKEEKYEMLNPQKLAQNAYTPAPTKYGPDANLVPGFKEALLTMNVGDKIIAYIPSHLGWGPRGAGNVIPPNADVIFEIELVEVK